MYRFLLIAGLLVIAYLLLRRAYRDFFGEQSRGQLTGKDQMVQDPHCLVYVPRGTAIEAAVGGQSYYFCSPGCAEAFRRRLSASSPSSPTT